MLKPIATSLPLLAFIGLLSCKKESGAEAPPTEPEEPAAEVVLTDYTPLEIPEGFLALSPRSQTEEEIDKLIAEQLKFVSVSGGFNEVYVRMSYGPELNLNPGPGGARPTYEGGALAIEGVVHLKDGTTIPAGPKAGSSQTWQADKGTFRDSRGLKIDGEAKTRDIEKIVGEVTLTLPVRTQSIELTKDGAATTEIADGLTLRPNWENQEVVVEYGENEYRKVLHVVGIDAAGKELKIVGRGGQQRLDHPGAGQTSFRFADTGPLERIHVYAAPAFIERKIPFEMKPE
ncbi:hypothetical protein [Haloferula rosea]|uniref:Uncharacterized protein n=1 Tax=Haloferula rosea TaxID=490093 RepID=A0A934RDS5_9BACT|nr:hypothetical protein [Haloferula rosea]MBK1828715.1 hypothetical protein [Haloferula rosea]